tara:strand:- start:15 stop:191 length:177 start_codon:yes stop_codon:yes gene_type:complete
MIGNGELKRAMKRQKSEEIVTKLRQVEVLVGHCETRFDAIPYVQNTGQIYLAGVGCKP